MPSFVSSILKQRDWLLPSGLSASLFLVGLVGLQAGQIAQPTKDEAARKAGRETFESVCAGCHGLDGHGGERGPNIAARPEVQRLSDAETLAIIQEGRLTRGMPAFSFLGAERLKGVLQHLRSLQGGGAIDALPGDSKSGKLLFFGKANCGDCHMVNGEGGFIGSDLSSFGRSNSPAGIRATIVEPNKNLNPRLRTVVVTGRDGKTYNGVARNEDNYSLQLQSADGTFHLFDKRAVGHIEYLPKSLMPADYGARLSSKELDDIVSYLVDVAKASRESHPSKGSGDGDEDDDN